MRVKIEELKQAFEMIFTFYLSECSEIELEHDAYWTVISQKNLDAKNGSPELGLGLLSEDIEALRKVLHGEHPLSINDFDRLGNIIIAIGEEIYRSWQCNRTSGETC